jgi:uncharacterized membrane protein
MHSIRFACLLLYFTLSAFIISQDALAARLYGTITNIQNQPLPFTNIYIKGTTSGTTSNEQGKYQLEMNEGNYEIVFHYIGFKRQIKNVSIGLLDVELNVQLKEEDIMLREVVVSAKEDPAYAIMRKAIAKRDYHYKQVNEYKCTAYVKGLNRIVSAPDKIFGIPLNSMGILDSNNSGIIYLSESVSEFSFRKPDNVKEKLIASKVSGRSDNFSWNSASDFNIIDFYKNSIHIDVVSDRVFISPLADNAMFYYRFRLANTYAEDNRLIYNIEVTPRRKNDPVYSGNIYIIDSLYNIHSLELMLTKNSQLKFIDSLRISQTFVPVEGDVWMPINKRFDVTFEILKIKAEGYYLAIYKDYNLHPDFEKKYFTNETLRVDEESNKKDSTYWNIERPVPLTAIEIEDYEKKAEVEELRKSKPYLDSLDRKANKFVPISLLLGYNYRKTYKKITLRTSPFINLLNFNTVEGYNLTLNLSLEKELNRKKILRFTPTFRYGIANRLFSSTLNSSFFYNRKKSGHINLDFGQYVHQFNRNEPITELANTIYTLLAERNYMKIFKEQYINVLHRIEVVNGLMLWASVGYSRRMPLNNANVDSWVDRKNISFTPNIPDNIFFNGNQFQQHDVFIIKFDLRYRPGQKYVTRPDMKIASGSKWPEFTASYKKAIPGVFKSAMNYDWIQLKVEDNMQLKMFGNMKYMFRVGTFLNKNRMEFMDFKHFNGNQTYIGRNFFDGFQVLDYYVASTQKTYYEAHLEHHFEGFLFNKIPGFRKLRFQEVLGVHFLFNEDYRDWVEIAAGIENILRVGRIDFVTGISRNHPTRFGVRIGILLNQF